MHLVDRWYAEAVASRGIRSPESARRTRLRRQHALRVEVEPKALGLGGKPQRPIEVVGTIVDVALV